MSTASSGWATVALKEDSSTDSGDTETVTASAGGVSAEQEIHFSGDPVECVIELSTTTPAAGTTVDISVTLLDSSGGPAADGIKLN